MTGTRLNCPLPAPVASNRRQMCDQLSPRFPGRLALLWLGNVGNLWRRFLAAPYPDLVAVDRQSPIPGHSACHFRKCVVNPTLKICEICQGCESTISTVLCRVA